MKTFTDLNLFNEYGKKITNEFSRDYFIIQVGKDNEPKNFCDITINRDEFEIEVTGNLTDEQFSFLEEACAEEIQQRKDQMAFERDMEDTEKWLLNN